MTLYRYLNHNYNINKTVAQIKKYSKIDYRELQWTLAYIISTYKLDIKHLLPFQKFTPLLSLSSIYQYSSTYQKQDRSWTKSPRLRRYVYHLPELYNTILEYCNLNNMLRSDYSLITRLSSISSYPFLFEQAL